MEILDTVGKIPDQPEQDLWQTGRVQYAQKVVNDDLRERLNNFRKLNLQLWSTAPEFEDTAKKLAATLWGHCRKKRYDHLMVVLANLWDTWRQDPTKYVGYHRNNSHYPRIPARYNPAHITKLLFTVMDDLADAGFIEHHRGRYNVEYRMGYLSKCRATPDLIDFMLDQGITDSMVGMHPEGELIQLKAPKQSRFKDGRVIRPKAGLLDYVETSQTRSMRAFLREYTDFLEQFDIRVSSESEPLSTSIYRVFNDGSWDKGGRFFSGGWMTLNEDDRKEILINGQPCIELDYGCCIPSLMYAMKGHSLPCEDIYYLEGFPRKLVKRAFMRAINNKGRGHAVRGLNTDILEKFPDMGNTMDASELIDRLVEAHPLIRDKFFQKYGLILQGLESDICELVLKTLTREEICCLSIHDSFIVQVRHEGRLREVMQSAFRTIMNVSYDPIIK